MCSSDLRLRENEKKQQVPPLRYAPVGMTLLFGTRMWGTKQLFRIEMLVPKRKYHPDRSVAKWRDLLFLS